MGVKRIRKCARVRLLVAADDTDAPLAGHSSFVADSILRNNTPPGIDWDTGGTIQGLLAEFQPPSQAKLDAANKRAQQFSQACSARPSVASFSPLRLGYEHARMTPRRFRDTTGVC
jgi:hypothetical protein